MTTPAFLLSLSQPLILDLRHIAARGPSSFLSTGLSTVISALPPKSCCSRERVPVACCIWEVDDRNFLRKASIHAVITSQGSMYSFLIQEIVLRSGSWLMDPSDGSLQVACSTCEAWACNAASPPPLEYLTICSAIDRVSMAPPPSNETQCAFQGCCHIHKPAQ